MSRLIEGNYYKTDSSLIPVRWSSPESLEYREFTHKSDVWSFGVILYELFSYGKVPYASMSNSEVLEEINKGYRLPKPETCPEVIYEMMLKCWKKDPKERPSFAELSKEFARNFQLSPILTPTGSNPSDHSQQFYQNNDSYET